MTYNGDNAVEEFATWLRQIKLLGGDLSLRELERRTQATGTRVARSTIQDALDARRLPSIDHAVAMVRAMTGDESAVDECRRKWRKARSAIRGWELSEIPAPASARPAPHHEPTAPRQPGEAPPSQEPGTVWWRSRTVLTTGAFVAALALAGGVYAATAGSGSADHARGNAKTSTPAAPAGTSSAAGPDNPSGPAAAPPPYLHIQAQFAGCHGANYYTETTQQYRQSQRAGQWGVGPGVIDITNQTSSNEAVLLTGMRVLTRKRSSTPTSGIVVADGQCGAAQGVRPFTYDLDKPNEPVVAQPDLGGPGDPGHPPVAFPFKISPGDPEVFELTANDTTCDCTLAVEIDWVAAGKAGKTILDNGGRGFRVLAAPNVPTYKLGGPSYTDLERVPYKDVFP